MCKIQSSNLSPSLLVSSFLLSCSFDVCSSSLWVWHFPIYRTIVVQKA